MFGKVFLYSSGEAKFFKDMGIGVRSCTSVAKYSCIVVVKPSFLKIWALVCILVLMWQSILV